MIRLRTLGALDLRGSDGQELRAVLAQPKRAALLAYLALASPRGRHRRDTLVALFWPELDAEHARNSLSQAIRFLRRSLGEEVLISRNGDGLELAAQEIWCDAVAFEEALDAGRAADAVGLYRGELLEGFHVANAPDFERWLEDERQRLARRHMTAVETLAAEREAQGDFAGAAVWWRRLAVADPYNSRVALRLVRALGSAGDRGGAVQHARVHETLLREELGVAPDPAVARLARELQAADQPLVLVPPQPSPSSERAPAPGPDVALATPALSPPQTNSTTSRRVPRRTASVVAVGLVVLLAAAAGLLALSDGRGTPAGAPIRTLAVMPLANLSGDSAQQPLVDGMHDALITELARYPDLSVISRISVMKYKDSKMSLPEIARELKVDGLVEGSVLRDGDRVSVRAQLVHGPSDRHLWARRYERDLRDMLLLQGELAEAIAREVRVVTAPVQRARRGVAGRLDSTARELYLKEHYLRGRHAEISRSPTGLEAAKEAYRRATERDSTFALGYAGLSTAYYLLADYDYAPVRPALDSARIMARRGVALDSMLSETRTALAVILASDREFEPAERQFKRAIDLSPSDARAHYWYSVLLVALGRGEEALREANRAAELDPFAPRGVTGMQRYARWLVTGERPHMKVPVAQRRHPILKLEPGEPIALAWEALDLAEQGSCTEALSGIQRAQRLVPDTNIRMLGHVAPVYWLCGERSRARAVVQQMKRRRDSHDRGYWIGMVLALFGERDSAFAWLRRHQWTLGEFSSLSADRRLDPLRPDPRYGQLLQELGLRPKPSDQN
jgi:DNA-binding SARP family transcriptional activator/TolB-like protein/Flp pilus assembly protein TadD